MSHFDLRRTHVRQWPTALLAGVVSLLLGGCTAAADEVVISPSDDVVSAGAAAAPERAASAYLACIDVTTSIPRWFVERALGRVADDIEASVTGPMQQATFYLRSTVATSYWPDAELGTVQLTAVPRPPDSPQLSPNIYEQAANDGAMAEYRMALTTWKGTLDKARATAGVEAARVRSLDPRPDATGTDVLGCPLRAPGLLGTDGDRRLVIFSDLLPSGPQQAGLPAASLRGVAVTIAFYCTELANTCAERLAAFSDLLRGAGATDITVVDPQALLS